jgi:hypothetical protein
MMYFHHARSASVERTPRALKDLLPVHGSGALMIASTGHRLDGATDTEEATYRTQFSLDLDSGTGGALRDRRIRVLVDITLARAVPRAAFFLTCRV